MKILTLEEKRTVQALEFVKKNLLSDELIYQFLQLEGISSSREMKIIHRFADYVRREIDHMGVAIHSDDEELECLPDGFDYMGFSMGVIGQVREMLRYYDQEL